MDFWFVAAAAGAEYFAKHWQNLVLNIRLSDSNAGFSAANDESWSLIGQIGDVASPFCKSGRRKPAPEPATRLLSGSCSDERSVETAQSGSVLSENVASTSTLFSLANFPVGIPRDMENNEYTEEIPVFGTSSNFKVLDQHGLRRGQRSIRSRRTRPQFLKPLTSLESCLMAQLYKGHPPVEQDVLRPVLSPPTPMLRPFYVTDGSQIISRSSSGSFGVHVREEKTMPPGIICHVNGQLSWIPYLPTVEQGQGSRQQNLHRMKNQNATSSNASIKDMPWLGPGSPSGAVLLCLGIFVGMLYTLVANKAQVDKLKGQLKQSENLVEDLQEELEMKDSLTVKELVKDDHSLVNANDSSINEKNQNTLAAKSYLKEEGDTKYDSEEADAPEPSDSSEKLDSITNIEAELEAELERLELNMKESSLQRRLSDIMEVDPDSVPEVIRGDLRADMVRAGTRSSSAHDFLSSTSTPDASKQAVLPHELCLRLHEVIKSRLEQRIMELEVALVESQKRVQQLESERAISWREHLHSESSSTLDSPMARPLVMNLAGEALDAYNEAYEVLGGVSGAGQEDECLELDKDNQLKLFPFHDTQGRLSLLDPDGHNDIVNGAMLSPLVVKEVTRPDFTINWKSKEASPNMYEDSEGDNDDDDDAMGFLIRQLVEKARQGSPAVLQAHRAMISLDTD